MRGLLKRMASLEEEDDTNDDPVDVADAETEADVSADADVDDGDEDDVGADDKNDEDNDDDNDDDNVVDDVEEEVEEKKPSFLGVKTENGEEVPRELPLDDKEFEKIERIEEDGAKEEVDEDDVDCTVDISSLDKLVLTEEIELEVEDDEEENNEKLRGEGK